MINKAKQALADSAWFKEVTERLHAEGRHRAGNYMQGFSVTLLDFATDVLDAAAELLNEKLS